MLSDTIIPGGEWQLVESITNLKVQLMPGARLYQDIPNSKRIKLTGWKTQ
jgi:hypothetical protein